MMTTTNQSKGKASSVSESISKDSTDNEMDLDLLDYEPEELQDMAGEVIEEVKEPEGKKKRVRRQEEEEKDLPEEEEEEDTGTILRSEFLELTSMKVLMQPDVYIYDCWFQVSP